MGPDEFISVTADLVRRLGSANAALVWARIEFVCRISGRDRVEDEDGVWWVVSKPKLAQDIGLSERTVRSTLENLIKQGHIEAKMVDESSWNRSLAYRAVGSLSAGHAHRTNMSDASDENGRCIGPERPIDQTKMADVPYIEEVKNKKKVIADDPTFDEWWKHYPRKVKKIEAKKAYAKALKLTDPDTLLGACKAFAKQMEGKEAEYIAHPTSWLNQGRWEDEGLAPVNHGSVKQWLIDRYHDADTRSVEHRSGMTYRQPDPPDGADIRIFLKEARQQWIKDNHDEIIRRIMAREENAA